MVYCPQVFARKTLLGPQMRASTPKSFIVILCDVLFFFEKGLQWQFDKAVTLYNNFFQAKNHNIVKMKN